jgi:hypothetical protein
MTLWKVDKYYHNNNDDVPVYEVSPYHLRGHLQCCLKWYGIKGLKWCYLFKKQAERKAKKLNKRIKSNLKRRMYNETL